MEGLQCEAVALLRRLFCDVMKMKMARMKMKVHR